MSFDRSAYDLDDPAAFPEIIRAAHRVRHHREEAGRLRRLAGFWRANPGVASEGEAEDHALYCEGRALEHSRLELEALGLLNDALARHGATAGQRWEVGDSIYLVARDGLRSTHLGRSIPRDDPADDEDDSDPGHSDRDELADRMAEYAEMVRIP